MSMKVVTLKVPEWFIAMMDTEARKYGLSRSELIRAAVYYVIKNGLVEKMREYDPVNGVHGVRVRMERKGDENVMVIEID